MAQRITTYNSREILTTLGGLEMYGFGKESKITISRTDALAEGETGVDGEDTIINFFNSTLGKAELTLIYGSDWDIALDQIASQQLPIVLSFYHKESNKVLVSVAWVEEQPDTVLGTKADDRTWMIGLQNADFSLAQNAEATIAGYKFFTGY